MAIDRTIALYLILLGLEIAAADTARAKNRRPSRLLQSALQLVQRPVLTSAALGYSLIADEPLQTAQAGGKDADDTANGHDELVRRDIPFLHTPHVL